MKDKILRLIDSYNFEQKEGVIFETKVWTDIYVLASLKTTFLTKSKAAAKIHEVKSDEEILLLIQNGMSEKDSVVVTEKYISIAISNYFSKNEQKTIYWNDIKEIKSINHTIVFDVENNEQIIFDVNKVFTKNVERAGVLIQLLQKILRITKGEKEIVINHQGFINKNKFLIGIVIAIIGGVGLFLSNQFKNADELPKQKGFKEDTVRENTVREEATIKVDTIWSDVPLEGFQSLLSYETINVFYEPYEVTMQKQSRWTSTKEADRIIIPIEIPEGTKYWVYRLNLLNARVESEKEMLYNDVTHNVKKLKILGINVKESSTIESSLVRELLNNLSSPDKTKPFTNIYFINNQSEAEKFQDFKSFKSDINNSIRKTHSRNGLIKFNKSQYVYLGLENEGYKDDIYVYLEVVALIEKMSYFKIEEKLQ